MLIVDFTQLWANTNVRTDFACKITSVLVLFP